MMKKKPQRYVEVDVVLETERTNQPPFRRRSTADLQQLISVKPKVNFVSQSYRPIQYNSLIQPIQKTIISPQI